MSSPTAIPKGGVPAGNWGTKGIPGAGDKDVGGKNGLGAGEPVPVAPVVPPAGAAPGAVPGVAALTVAAGVGGIGVGKLKAAGGSTKAAAISSKARLVAKARRSAGVLPPLGSEVTVIDLTGCGLPCS